MASPMPESLALDAVIELTAALALGAVIGLERGWRQREGVQGSRVAGLRTFALLGLFGGVLGVSSVPLGPLPAAAGLAGVCLLATAAYHANMRESGKLSATTAVAMPLTAGLGLLAGIGQPALALSAAVIAAVIPDLKPTLHRWLRLVEHRELRAALQMLVLSAVILPLLPDRGYGPYAALNPHQFRRADRRSILVRPCRDPLHRSEPRLVVDGRPRCLASSTATTLGLARRVREDPLLLPPCGTVDRRRHAGKLEGCRTTRRPSAPTTSPPTRRS